MSVKSRGTNRRLIASVSTVVVFVSMLVVGTASPVSATSLGGNHKGVSSDFSLVEDQNNCTQFLDVDGDGTPDYSSGEGGGSGSSGSSGVSGSSGSSGSSGLSGGSGASGGSGSSGASGGSGGGSEGGGILRQATGTVRASGSPVANAVVLSYSVEFVDNRGVIGAMTCAMTNSSGAFTINVINQGGFGEILISPPFTASYGTQLGSVGRVILPDESTPPSAAALGNIDLVPANNMAFFYSWSVQDFVTAPSNIICHTFADESSTEWDILGGCAVARGMTTPPQSVVAMKTVTVDDYSEVRFYLAPGSVTLVPGAFTISGLPAEQSAFNGRWTSGTFKTLPTEDLDGAGGLPALSYVSATYGGDPVPTGAVASFSAPYPTLRTVTWAASTTIPANTQRMTQSGFENVNLADGTSRDAAVLIISRNRIGSGHDVNETFRYQSISNAPNSDNGDVSLCGSTPEAGCNPFTALTTLGSDSTRWGRGVVTWLDERPGGGGGGSGGGGSCGPIGSGNYQGLAVTDLTAMTPFTECAYVSLSPFSPTAWGDGPGWDSQSPAAASRTVSSNGQFVLPISTTGIYRLEFGPFASTTIAKNQQVVRVTVTDTAVTAVETCASFSLMSGFTTDESRCTSGWVTATPSDGRYLLLAPAANFVGQVRLPNGTPLSLNNGTHVEVRRPMNYGSNWVMNGDGTGAPTKADGKFLLNLAPGSYQLFINPPQGITYPALEVNFRVSVVGGVTVIERCSTFSQSTGTLSGCGSPLGTSSWASPITDGLQFTSGDMTGKGWVTYSGPSSGGNVATNGFWVEINKDLGRCESGCYENIGGTSAGNTGEFSVNFASAGSYKLVLNQPWQNSAGLTRTEVLVTVTITDGVKSLVVTQNGTPVTKDGNGVYNFVYNSANFVTQVLTPNPGSTPVNNSWVNVQELTVQSGGSNQWANFTTWVDGARTDSEGKARLSFTRSGYFRVVASNPTTEPYPELMRYLKVDVAGASVTFYSCTDFRSGLVDRAPKAGTWNDADSDADIDDALECSSTPVAATSGSPLTMQFVGAEFTGRVTGSGNFWVEIRKMNTDMCESCDEYIGGTQANQTGVFGITFASTGTYKLLINPPWNDTSGATRTEVTVVVAGESGSRTFTVTRSGTTVVPDSGVYSFSLNSANFKGLVSKSGTPEAYSNVSFEKWNDENGRWEWSSTWANTNSSGQFLTTLANGTWKITARPSWQSEGTASAVVLYAKIAGDVVSVGGVATTQTCAEAVPSSSDLCTRLATDSDGRYLISLGTPNFSGYAAVASDSSRDGSGVPTGESALGYSWMEVQVWNEFEQQYRWSPDVTGINTSANGRFASSLPNGKYQIILNPRPQDVTAGRSRGTFRVKVVSGVVLCDANYGSWCTANSAPAANRFDLHLSAANFTGTVTAGSGNVVNGNVNAQKWNGQWFEWMNLWAQTGSSGRFAMNLETDGIYKITAEAPSWNNTYAGYANVFSYVKVASGVLCEIASETATTCAGPAGSSLDLSMALTGANVRGQVTQTGGSSVGNTWVNVMRYNNALGWWEWLTGAPVNSSGQFSLSLVPSSDGDSFAGTQQRFKIEVMPPWGNSTLTRKEVQLWVGAVGQGSGDNFYRVCSESSFSLCTELPASGNAGATLSVVLSAGNVTGRVTTDGSTGMPHAWINVEKWMTPSWSSQPMWQWIELSANANATGNYSLPLDAQGNGHYRITANPGWNNPTNLTRTSVVVYQVAGSVCTVDSGLDSVCNDGSSPTYTRNIQLAGSNLAGTLLNSSTAVPNAWVALMQEQNGPTDVNVDRENTWYQWLGGSNSSATGTFGMRLESEGRYQLEVNPPWNQSLTRFSVYLYAKDGDSDGIEAGEIEADEIFVCGSKSQSNADCFAANTVWSSGSNSQLSFPTPNVAIRVCDKDDSDATCTPIQNAWVTVFRGYEWIAGANTNSAGIAQFRLGVGTNYKFEANPNWANPDGSRVETAANVSINESGVLEPVTVASPIIGYSDSDKRIDIRLGRPNVAGLVYYQGGTQSVVNKALTDNVATLTTFAAHGYVVGTRVVVSGVGSPFNGTHTVTAMTATTFSFAVTATNVVSVSATGTSTIQVVMPFAYVGVRRNESGGGFSYLPGAPVNASGNYALALGNGSYTLTAYPNGNIAERAPTSISVTVAGGVATCNGVADTCSIDFDAATKNVNFTMTSMGTFTRTLFVYSGDTLVTSLAKAPVDGTVSMSLALPAGSYTLRVQKLNTFATDGSTPLTDFDGPNGSACREFTLVVSGDPAVVDVDNQLALDTWAGGFIGDDSSTGLECRYSVG